MKNKKYLILFISIIAIILAACTKNTKTQETVDYTDPSNPIAIIQMEDGALIKLELYPKAAPNTVNNFISLANTGFYNGLTFHRIVPGFVIQGGDPKGTGMGGPGYSIKGEFSSNGFNNNLKHTKGIISMARSKSNDSAGSQFFIVVADAKNLDGDYAAFGKVIEGMEFVDKIVSEKRDGNDKPINPIVIKNINVDLKGKTYSEPEKIKLP